MLSLSTCRILCLFMALLLFLTGSLSLTDADILSGECGSFSVTAPQLRSSGARSALEFLASADETEDLETELRIHLPVLPGTVPCLPVIKALLLPQAGLTLRLAFWSAFTRPCRQEIVSYIKHQSNISFR